ncbi:MAG: DUF433 domain-containing protein [Rhodoplanes sp.]
MPCIRGLRIPAATVVGMIADGMSEAEVLQGSPILSARTLPRRSATRQMRSLSANCL